MEAVQQRPTPAPAAALAALRPAHFPSGEYKGRPIRVVPASEFNPALLERSRLRALNARLAVMSLARVSATAAAAAVMAAPAAASAA